MSWEPSTVDATLGLYWPQGHLQEPYRYASTPGFGKPASNHYQGPRLAAQSFVPHRATDPTPSCSNNRPQRHWQCLSRAPTLPCASTEAPSQARPRGLLPPHPMDPTKAFPQEKCPTGDCSASRAANKGTKRNILYSIESKRKLCSEITCDIGSGFTKDEPAIFCHLPLPFHLHGYLQVNKPVKKITLKRVNTSPYTTTIL